MRSSSSTSCDWPVKRCAFFLPQSRCNRYCLTNTFPASTVPAPITARSRQREPRANRAKGIKQKIETTIMTTSNQHPKSESRRITAEYTECAEASASVHSLFSVFHGLAPVLRPSGFGLRISDFKTAGLVLTSIALLAGCAALPSSKESIGKQSFGKTPDGAAIDLYTLRNSKGAEAQICSYGGIVVSLKVPDRTGHLGDVVLGYDHLDSYVKNSPFFGALIGRYGNRIAKAKFSLHRKENPPPPHHYPNYP